MRWRVLVQCLHVQNWTYHACTTG